MAEAEKATVTTINAITSKTNVLAIGDDPKESLVLKEPTEKYNRECSPVHYCEHLRQLLVGNCKNIQIDDDWNKQEYFAAASIKKDNQPRQYHFHYGRGRNFPPSTIISGPTWNAQNVMKEVRKRLSHEKWISNNVIETPLKANSKPYYTDQYIQQIVSESFDAETKRLLKFVIYLHREQIK